MNAYYACPTCGLTYNDEEDLSIPSALSTEFRIERLEYRARTFIDGHQQAHPQTTKHPPETRSIPDGNEEGTAADYAIIQVPPTADVVLFNKEGGFIGARWNPDQEPGTAIEGLAEEYGFNLRYGYAGRWDFDRSKT